MASSSVPNVPGLPPLSWLKDIVGDASLSTNHGEANAPPALQMTAGPKTDYFNPPPDPSSPAGLANAPALVFDAPPGDWQLSAKVSCHHKYLFDAATIICYRNSNEWCKLCYELSPEKKPLIVSVVTRDISDDANGAAVEGGTVHLRISKYGAGSHPVMAFHYSIDGTVWTLHRAFCMRQDGAHDACASGGASATAKGVSSLRIGFLAQCPTGETCTASFTRIKFEQTTLSDLRDGS